MSKTETFKDLPAPANGADLIESGQFIQALRHANMDSIQRLSEHLEPLARVMSGLAEKSTRAMVDLGHLIREAEAAASKASRESQAASERIAQETSRLTLKLWAAMITVGAITAPLAWSAFSALEHRSSEDRDKATKWETFTGDVYPKLDKRCQDTLNRIWK